MLRWHCKPSRMFVGGATSKPHPRSATQAMSPRLGPRRLLGRQAWPCRSGERRQLSHLETCIEDARERLVTRAKVMGVSGGARGWIRVGPSLLAHFFHLNLFLPSRFVYTAQALRGFSGSSASTDQLPARVSSAKVKSFARKMVLAVCVQESRTHPFRGSRVFNGPFAKMGT